MPADKLSDSFKYADECDLCIILDSSLVVYPAASISEKTVENGAKLMIVNRDSTHLDPLAELVIHDSLSGVLDNIII